MHVKLSGELKSSETLLGGHFSKILLFCDLFSIFQWPRLPLWSSHQKAELYLPYSCCTLSLSYPESIAGKRERQRERGKKQQRFAPIFQDHISSNWRVSFISLRILGACFNLSLLRQLFTSLPAETRGLLELSLSAEMCLSWFWTVLRLGYSRYNSGGQEGQAMANSPQFSSTDFCFSHFLLLVTFNSPQTIPHILSRFFQLDQWKRHNRVCLLLFTLNLNSLCLFYTNKLDAYLLNIYQYMK